MGQKSKLQKRVQKRTEFRKIRKEQEKKSLNHTLIWVFIIAPVVLWLCTYTSILNVATNDNYVFFGIGSVFVLCAVVNLGTQIQTRKWKACGCIIEAKEVDISNSRGGHSWFPVIYFKYNVSGVEYVSNELHRGLLGKKSMKKAYQRVSKYNEGDKTTCFYNPKKPSHAVLENHITMEGPLFFLVYALIIYLIPVVVHIWKK
jgi:hypothetical protein